MFSFLSSQPLCWLLKLIEQKAVPRDNHHIPMPYIVSKVVSLTLGPRLR